jgi:anti-sigma-K factor RskA
MKNIEEELQKTLSSLDNIQKAEPKPFLFTRINARLEAASADTVRQFDLRPAFVRIASAALVLLLVFNFVTATLFIGTDTDLEIETTTEEAFISQYYPAMTTLDNLEQNITE